jgi:hypothetical protein
MQGSQSLTLTSNGGLLNAIVSEIKICEPGTVSSPASTGSLSDYKAIWDTGATNSVITQKVADALKIKPIGAAKVNGVDGEHTSPVYLVDFIFPSGVLVQSLRVTLGKLPAGADALIGMDIITLGDFSITNLNSRTKMSFRMPSCAEVDYVAEAQRQQYTRKQRRAMEREDKKRNKANP